MTKINILEYHVMSLKSQGLNSNPRKFGWNRNAFLVEELEDMKTWEKAFPETVFLILWGAAGCDGVLCHVHNLHSRLETQLYLYIVVHRGSK